jgi:hypothetical protein
MLLKTTKKQESFQDTFYSPSETTKNSTNFFQTPQLLKEVFFLTFQVPQELEKKAQATNHKLFDLFL